MYKQVFTGCVVVVSVLQNMKFPITQKQSFESTGRSESGQSYHNGIPSNLQLSGNPMILVVPVLLFV